LPTSLGHRHRAAHPVRCFFSFIVMYLQNDLSDLIHSSESACRCAAATCSLSRAAAAAAAACGE
jgi:hypothetical protein